MAEFAVGNGNSSTAQQSDASTTGTTGSNNTDNSSFETFVTSHTAVSHNNRHITVADTSQTSDNPMAVSDQSQQKNKGGQEDGESASGDQQKKRDSDALFQSRTNYDVGQIEINFDKYVTARQAGRNGATATAALNSAGGKLLADTTDELRQIAVGAADPKKAIRDRAEIIKKRIPQNSKGRAIALDIVDQATQRVLAEAPEERDLQVKRMRVFRARETLDVLKTTPEMKVERREAEKEFDAAIKDLQDAALKEIGKQVASVHLENALAGTKSPNASADAQQLEAKLTAARNQAEAVQSGQLPIDFTDAEMTKALGAVKHKFAGIGLDAYFNQLGAALKKNRDFSRIAMQAPLELSVEVAKLHNDNVSAQRDTAPGNQTQAAANEANAQLTAARNGQVPIDFTDAEMSKALANVKARHRNNELGPVFDDIARQITANRDAVKQSQQLLGAARQKIASELAIATEFHALPGVPQELVKSDPVSAAFVRALGVNIEPKNPNLSLQEQTIAGADPIAFALLQKAGIRIESTNVNTTIVTGQQGTLTPAQQEMLKNNDVFGLASSLLSNAKLDLNTQAMIVATIEARHQYTSTQVSQLLAAGKPSEALRVLDVNISAAFTPDERIRLWTEIGEPAFNQQYFDKQVDAFLTAHKDDYQLGGSMGEWLKTNFGRLPQPAAEYLINSITTKIKDPTRVTDTMGSGVFYGAFSAVVEHAPNRAADAAKWYTGVPGKPDGFRRPLSGFPMGYAIKNKFGTAFSNAIVEHAEQAGQKNPLIKNYAQALRGEFNSVVKEFQQSQGTRIVRDIFHDFQAQKNLKLQKYFDSFATGPDVTQWMPAADTPALRNMVGRSLGLTPTNQDAANRLDNTKDWFDSGEQKNMVDMTAKALLLRAGSGGAIRGRPAFLAGELIGAQNYTLFEVKKGQTVETEIIDGTVVANMIYANPALVKKGGGIVDKIDDKMHGDWHYKSFQDFQEDNNLPDNAKLYVMTDFALKDANRDGHVDYTETAAAITTGWEKTKMVGDIVITAGSIIAGVVLAVPSGGMSLGVAAAVAAPGLVWGGIRLTDQYLTMRSHGQSMGLSNPNARGLYISAAGQVLAVAALGTGGLAQAAKAPFLKTALNTTSRVTGGSAFGIGAYQTGTGIYNIASNAGQMTNEQLLYESLNLGLGVLDMGIGAWNHRRSRVFEQRMQQARDAIDFHNQGKAIPEQIGTLDFVKDGVVRFTSGQDGKPIDISFKPGEIRLPDIDAKMPEMWRTLNSAVPGQREISFLDNGEINVKSADGQRTFVLHPANEGQAGGQTGEGAPGKTAQLVQDINKQLTDRFGGYIPKDAKPPRIYVVNDEAFKTIHGQLSGPEAALQVDLPALLVDAGVNGKVMVIKEGAFDESITGLTRTNVAHETLKTYAHPAFRQTAEGIPVNKDAPMPSNMLEGMAEYLAWRETEYPAWRKLQEGGEGTYTDYLKQQIEHVIAGNPAEWSYPLEAVAAEHIFKQMGEEQVYKAMFQGDAEALARFQKLSQDLLPAAKAAESEPRSRLARTLATIHEFSRYRAGHRLFGFFKSRAQKTAATPEEYAHYFNINKIFEPSALTKDAIEGLRLVGDIADLMADIHAHSRPYDRRRGDRAVALIEKTGSFARILIGDIPQACGFAHYSNINAQGLTIKHSQLLDELNTQQFKAMLGNYRKWAQAIDEVKASRPELARDLDFVVLTAARDKEGKFTGAGKEHFDQLLGQVADPALIKRLRDAARTNPHLALRGDLSLTGFNPGSPESVNYIRQQLLKNPGAYKFLGELTLQKEMVAVMLGDEATLLEHPQFTAFKQAIEAYGRHSDNAALQSAIEAFRKEPQSERVKEPLTALDQALKRGNGADIRQAILKLDEAVQRVDLHQKQTIENFKQMLALAEETGIGVLIHCDWGEADVGPDGRPQATPSDYRYFDQLIDIVKQHPKANIVLAHTGIGRFVRPNETLVDYTLPNGNVVKIPQHIARMEEALKRAPNVKFDISWNDVGEAFVKNRDMFDGLKGFIARHPEAIIFGSDTVKPVNQEQYRQASSTLMPFFAELARENPEGLKGLVRDNYENLLRSIDERVARWTEEQLTAQAANDPEAMAKIEQMHRDRALLGAGRDWLRQLADAQFQRTMDNIEGLRANGLSSPLVEPWVPNPNQRVRRDLFDINRLGAAPPKDETSATAPWLPMKFTPRGYPADAATVADANTRALVESGVTTLLALASGAASTTPAGIASNLPSVARQFLFAAKIQYKEYVRLSWEEIFEEGHASPANVQAFLDRVMKVGNAVGVDQHDLRSVVEMTLQFRKDYEYVSKIEVNDATGWTEKRKKEAISYIAGLYQINVDRALGVQASSLDKLDPRVNLGRELNNGIARTAGMSTGVSALNLAKALEAGDVAKSIFAGGAATADITALTTMIAKAILENRGGRSNVPEVEAGRIKKWLGTVSLGGLAAGGGLRTVTDVMSILSGDLSGLLGVLDSRIAYYGYKSARSEYWRTKGTPVEDLGARAGINQKLVTAIALAGLARTVMAIHDASESAEKGLDNLRANQLKEVDTIAVPTDITPPLETAPTGTAPGATQPTLSLPEQLSGTPPVEVISAGGLNVRLGPDQSAARIGAFAKGAILQPTGRTAPDKRGALWIEVTGVTARGQRVSGWVAAANVREHRGSGAPDRDGGKRHGALELTPGQPKSVYELWQGFADHQIPG